MSPMTSGTQWTVFRDWNFHFDFLYCLLVFGCHLTHAWCHDLYWLVVTDRSKYWLCIYIRKRILGMASIVLVWYLYAARGDTGMLVHLDTVSSAWNSTRYIHRHCHITDVFSEADENFSLYRTAHQLHSMIVCSTSVHFTCLLTYFMVLLVLHL